jgi:hypothetical protein
VVAVLAVLGSLVFVGVQIRQNTRFQKIAAVDALSNAIAGVNRAGMETPDLGVALAAASQDWGTATRAQRILAHYFLMSYFKLAENAWNQRRAGIPEPDQWFGWENMLITTAPASNAPGGRAATTPSRRPSRPIWPARAGPKTSPLRLR